MDEARAAIVSYIFLAVAIFAAICVPIAVQWHGGSSMAIMLRESLFTQAASASPFVMYRLWEGDRRSALRSTMLASAVILVAIMLLLAGWLSPVRMIRWSLLGIGLVGLGSILAAAASTRDDSVRWRYRFAPALYLPLGVAMTPFFLWLSGKANPVYDLYVFAFEETLGARFSVLAVHLFEALPPLKLGASLCYVALPLGIATLYAVQQRGRAEVDIALAFVVATVIGYCLYFVFPVIGPLNVYGDRFPDSLPPVGSITAADLTVVTGEPRNGMPSLHTAWAMLIWINARPLTPRPRWLFRIFALLNLLATMGLRDAHWLTDLVVGAPLAVAVQALCSMTLSFRSRTRWIVFSAALALVLAWFAALWWGIAVFQSVRGLSWFSIAATLATAVALERSLRTVTLVDRALPNSSVRATAASRPS